MNMNILTDGLIGDARVFVAVELCQIALVCQFACTGCGRQKERPVFGIVGPQEREERPLFGIVGPQARPPPVALFRVRPVQAN